MKKILISFKIFNILVIIFILLLSSISFKIIVINRFNEVNLLNTFSKLSSLPDYKYKIINITKNYESFINKYEEKILIEASREENKKFNDLSENKLFSNWDSLQYQLADDKNINLDWSVLWKNFYLSNNIINLLKEKILSFYNIIAKIYNINNYNALKWVKSVLYNNELLLYGILGQTIYNTSNNSINIQFSSTNIFNKSLLQHAYNLGAYSSNDMITVIVHEFGHVLDFFIRLSKEKRLTLNNNNHYKIKEPNYYISRKLLSNFLNNKAGINDSKEKELFPLIVVRSNYGRLYSFLKPEIKTNDSMGDLFAEGFAQWLLTPENLRGWNWELLNEFFMEEVPKYLKNN